MSWSENRSSRGTAPAAADPTEKDALERVDGLLKGLAGDKLFQDDLRHPDVQKALQHWTGHQRLPNDEADELMQDNYRVHAVFKKMAALQACCRAGGIGTPLAQVLSGTGLHPANPITAQQQSPTNTSLRHAASLGANHNTGKAGRDFFQSAESRPNRGQRRTSTGVRNQSANEADGSARERAPKKKKTGQKDVLWRQAIVEELSKIVAVCACALLFFTAFKFFRGGDLWG